MSESLLNVERYPLIIKPDTHRVLFRPFHLGNERMVLIVNRLLTLTEEEVEHELAQVFQEFRHRHQAVEAYLDRRAKEILSFFNLPQELSPLHQLLIGAYFTHEYALEAAALFNPSIVWHPDQNNLPEGCRRFIISLRATGEGHISSIVFRSGFVDQNCGIWLDGHSRYVTPPNSYTEAYLTLDVFKKKIHELGLDDGFASSIASRLPENVSYSDVYPVVKEDPNYPSHRVAGDGILALMKANYEVHYSDDRALSERILFPYSPNEMNGMEDARFVEFTEEDGSKVYYATYTAYNGRVIFPQLLETRDFMDFRVKTMAGDVVKNKGMALFPRKINGKYVMLGRQDGENIYLMETDNLYFWETSQLLLAPKYPWEFVQLGNCGSPIETPEGWLVLSHGVGAMRKYCIGVFLLDLDNPQKVLARLPYPILTPEGEEREGYVPNVVYTCGAVVHADRLLIPYAMSDYSTGFATIAMEDLMGALRKEIELGKNAEVAEFQEK